VTTTKAYRPQCKQQVPTRPGRTYFPVPLFARCSRRAVAGSRYCKQHQPASERSQA